MNSDDFMSIWQRAGIASLQLKLIATIYVQIQTINHPRLLHWCLGVGTDLPSNPFPTHSCKENLEKVKIFGINQGNYEQRLPLCPSVHAPLSITVEGHEYFRLP